MRLINKNFKQTDDIDRHIWLSLHFSKKYAFLLFQDIDSVQEKLHTSFFTERILMCHNRKRTDVKKIV